MAVKSSRNAQRKAAYAGLANKGSRNQEQLAGPVVGRIVTVTSEPIVMAVKDEESWDGERRVVVGEKTVKPYQMVVHDDKPVKGETVRTKVKREPNAQKRLRQEGAWGRCLTKRQSGGHEFTQNAGQNCRSCGCPASAETQA